MTTEELSVAEAHAGGAGSTSVAFLVSIPAGPRCSSLLSEGVSAHVAAAIFAVSLVGLFGVSALYHTGNWAPHVQARWRRMDHAMIFVLIAGSYTPITLLALQPAWGISMLAIVWTVAVIGVTLALAAVRRAAPRRRLPLHRDGLDRRDRPARGHHVARHRRSSRCCSRAVCSTRSGRSGCGCSGRTLARSVFGYHEVWHAMTVAAAACHFTLVCMLVRA